MATIPPIGLGSQLFAKNDVTISDPAQMTSGSANTKGSYTEVIASTPIPASGLLIMPHVGGDEDYLIDIAIGGAGSEFVIVPNIQFSNNNIGSTFVASGFWVPLSIPQGSRLAARCQSSGASETLRIGIMLTGSTYLTTTGLHIARSYGTNTGDSGGTSIDPGGVANTLSSWVELNAAVDEINWMVVMLGSQQNAARANAAWGIDIGVGAAASEKVVVTRLYALAGSGHDLITPAFFAFPCHIPAGERLAARAMCSVTGASDRLIDISVLGIG